MHSLFSFTLTPALDLLLSLVCLYHGFRYLRRGWDMLAVGYWMICGAAFTGVFHLGGLMEFQWIHDFLSAMSQLVGILAIGLGILALSMRQRDQRYGAYALALFGPIGFYYFYVIYRSPLVGLSIWAGAIFLIGFISMSWQLAKAGKIRYIILGLAALAVAGVGSVLEGYAPLMHPPAGGGFYLHPVDYLHISLIIALTALYRVVVAAGAVD